MVKILVVDDSLFSQKCAEIKLRQYLNDVQFTFANDGNEGFEKYKEIHADYIFLDLLMPNLNGKDLIRQLLDYDPNARIIVLTADIQKNVKEEIEKYNVFYFMNKPLNDEKAKFVSNLIRIDYENKFVGI
jgi:two-component system chemotaxis response regulator CheY